MLEGVEGCCLLEVGKLFKKVWKEGGIVRS